MSACSEPCSAILIPGVLVRRAPSRNRFRRSREGLGQEPDIQPARLECAQGAELAKSERSHKIEYLTNSRAGPRRGGRCRTHPARLASAVAEATSPVR